MPTRATYTPFYEDLPQHKQTLQLQQALEALGMPAKWSHLCYAFVPRLNTWCLAHNEGSPDISGLSPRQIADICGWPEPKKALGFMEALVDAGFLDLSGDEDGQGRPVTVKVHNLEHYLKPILSSRQRQAAYRERNALRNAGHNGERNEPRGASVTGDAETHNALRPKVKEKQKQESNTGNGRSSQSTAETAAEPATGYVNGKKPAPAAPGSDLKPEQPTATATAPTAEAERMRRWTIFATLLRNWGFIEPNVRRVLHWIGTRKGGVSRDLDVDFAQRILGTIKGISTADRSEVKKAMDEAKVNDPPAYLMYIFDKKPAFCPKDENLRLAKQGWQAVEKEVDAAAGYVAPAWLVEALQAVK